jgi:hypothetical protein
VRRRVGFGCFDPGSHGSRGVFASARQDCGGGCGGVSGGVGRRRGATDGWMTDNCHGAKPPPPYLGVARDPQTRWWCSLDVVVPLEWQRHTHQPIRRFGDIGQGVCCDRSMDGRSVREPSCRQGRQAGRRLRKRAAFDGAVRGAGLRSRHHRDVSGRVPPFMYGVRTEEPVETP